MAYKIKVMIADDTAVVRRILCELINGHEELEVIYQARNGADLLGAFAKQKPDVVVLDFEMPVMNGLETTKAIKALDASVEIILFSAVTTKGAEATIEALMSGASDYETKPSMVGHLDKVKNHIIDHLLPKVLSWGKKRYASVNVDFEPAYQAAQPPTTGHRQDLIAVGVSTGGPEALTTFLSQFPSDFDRPILIVQHMPAVFTKILAERLDSSCNLEVSEAADGDLIEGGKVLIAPGDYHMEIRKESLQCFVHLHQQEKVHFCRPAVDVLFKSVATNFGKNSLAIVLTGMGQDGLEGARRIHEQGGLIMVQDERSSVVWGMPGHVFREGLAHTVGNPSALAAKTLQLALSVEQKVRC